MPSLYRSRKRRMETLRAGRSQVGSSACLRSAAHEVPARSFRGYRADQWRGGCT